MKSVRTQLVVLTLIPALAYAIDSGTATNARALPDWKLEAKTEIAASNSPDAIGLTLTALTNKEETVMSMDGTVFTGQVKDGRPHGKGLRSSPTGTRQRGLWLNGDEFQVTGTLVCADGTIEVGSWNRDGTKSSGTITWTDGKKYEGEWMLEPGLRNNLPDGKGTMTWPDGRVYVGEFDDGLVEGRGKMTYPNGKVEDGLWKLGQYAGPAPPR